MITILLVIFALLATCQAADAEFENRMREEHNKVRSEHHAPPLKIDPKLSKDAQAEAERKAKIFAETNGFGPPPAMDAERNYNDNVWAQISYATSKFNATKIVKEWAAQADKHDWKKNFYDTKTGHFTQMVWKSTDELGVGAATVKKADKKFVMLVVVRYSPPGNILDEDTFTENVSPK